MTLDDTTVTAAFEEAASAAPAAEQGETMSTGTRKERKPKAAPARSDAPRQDSNSTVHAERGEYKGFPTLTLTMGRVSITFGRSKARLIAAAAEEIARFAEEE